MVARLVSVAPLTVVILSAQRIAPMKVADSQDVIAMDASMVSSERHANPNARAQDVPIALS